MCRGHVLKSTGSCELATSRPSTCWDLFQRHAQDPVFLTVCSFLRRRPHKYLGLRKHNYLILF